MKMLNDKELNRVCEILSRADKEKKIKEILSRVNAVYTDDNIQKIRYVKSLNEEEPLDEDEQKLIVENWKAQGFTYDVIFK